MGLENKTFNISVAPNTVVLRTIPMSCDTNRAVVLNLTTGTECTFCRNERFKFLVRIRRVDPTPTVVMQQFVDCVTFSSFNTLVPISETICTAVTYRVDIFAAECLTLPVVGT
ncbi:MAG: hypothetical protein PHC60_04210 [Heliobacteriaceae bacterium]|nr:hypothetical protein [Heliobacteriaceae bacterium]MDD4587582.1 hypothetical protein [Heliobacteriaceae bacterium]